MAIYDTEQLVRDLVTLYKSKLGAEITAINTEKNDFTIPNINANAWYFQNMNNEAFSYKRFIVYGLDQTPSAVQSQENNVIDNIEIFIEVVIPDSGEITEESIVYQLLRYSRALRQVGFKNFVSFQSEVKLTVSALTPTSFSFEGNMFRAAGISITAAKTAY